MTGWYMAGERLKPVDGDLESYREHQKARLRSLLKRNAVLLVAYTTDPPYILFAIDPFEDAKGILSIDKSSMSQTVKVNFKHSETNEVRLAAEWKVTGSSASELMEIYQNYPSRSTRAIR